MRLRTDALRDSMRAAMPTMSQRDAQRREIQLAIDAYELAGRVIEVIPRGATAEALATAAKLSEKQNRERMRMRTWQDSNSSIAKAPKRVRKPKFRGPDIVIPPASGLWV